MEQKEKGGDGGAGGDVEAASTEELNSKITTLEKEKNKEEEYRNYMQLERVRPRAPLFPCVAESASLYHSRHIHMPPAEISHTPPVGSAAAYLGLSLGRNAAGSRIRR